ncbi:MAG: NAD(P)-binding domain-containing protein [Actinomycetota bacterium]|nr:NAD(P)-binding domain-containing protein [Actinomycetota bacterium]
MTDRDEVDVDVLVIGAGQAGLGTGHWLARRTSLSFLVVDGAERLGESWRRRWDSLVLFTPRRFSSLAGTAMPRRCGEYASKDEMADYLAAYAARERLPVRLRTRVRTLTRGHGGFVAETTTGRIRARHVVVATGPYIAPFVPGAASGLDPAVAQLHSSAYRVADDLPGQDVLVVGAGNSAAQLAVELAGAGRRVTVAAPGGMWFLPSRVLGVSLYWWLWLTGVLNSPSTSRVSRMVRARGDGIIGRDLQELSPRGRSGWSSSGSSGPGAGRPCWRTGPRCVRTPSCGAPATGLPSTGCAFPARSTSRAGPSTTPAAPRSRGCTGSGCRGRPASTAGSSTASTGTPGRPSGASRPTIPSDPAERPWTTTRWPPGPR